MALKKSKKKEVLEKVSDIAKSTKSVIFVNFHGLTVGDATAMRRELKKSGIGYTVAKKTLAKKAFSEKGVTGTMPELSGELAVAYLKEGDDVTAPAREIRNFEKKFEGKVAILGGVFSDEFISKEKASELALIPSKQTLYGMFVNLINSPIQRMAIVVNEIAKSKPAA